MIRIRFAAAAALLLMAAEAQAFQRQLVITDQNEGAIEVLGDYPNIELLAIHCAGNIRALPSEIGKLKGLKTLVIDSGATCPINAVLPASLGALTGLEELVLDGAENPQGPNVWSHERHPFPKEMSLLKNLIRLDLGHNGLAEIPAFVKDLPRLQEFSFQGNLKLKTLPAFMANLRELTTLRLDANDLDDLPDFLNTLPDLRFVTLGDNCKITASEAKMKQLTARFPKVAFAFANQNACPSQ